MTTSTIRQGYVHGKNLATMVEQTIAGVWNNYACGSKITDKGVYEITFSYSIPKAHVTIGGAPLFYMGFGVYRTPLDATFIHKTHVGLGANNAASQEYPNQAPITVWVVKTDDVEMDFICFEGSAIPYWHMHNLNAVAKKIADI
jgi:hypothetical protein